jgi:hypothetical protein
MNVFWKIIIPFTSIPLFSLIFYSISANFDWIRLLKWYIVNSSYRDGLLSSANINSVNALKWLLSLSLSINAYKILIFALLLNPERISFNKYPRNLNQ